MCGNPGRVYNPLNRQRIMSDTRLFKKSTTLALTNKLTTIKKNTQKPKPTGPTDL